MAQMKMTDYEGQHLWTGPLAKLLEANAEDEEIQAEAPKLQVGESFTVGGGAGPLVNIERIA